MSAEFDIVAGPDPQSKSWRLIMTAKSYGPVSLLAPEIDRLIQELCTARDLVRAMNRPKHSLRDPT